MGTTISGRISNFYSDSRDWPLHLYKIIQSEPIGRNPIFKEMSLNKASEKEFMMNVNHKPEQLVALERDYPFKFYNLQNYKSGLDHGDNMKKVQDLLSHCKFG